MAQRIIPDGGEVSKDPSDSAVYQVDWDAALADAVSITTSTFTITALRPSTDTSLTKDNETSGSRDTQLRLIGGTIGALYRINNQIVTDEVPAQTIERSFKVKIEQR